MNKLWGQIVKSDVPFIGCVPLNKSFVQKKHGKKHSYKIGIYLGEKLAN
jgi:hypothetical protein